MLTGELKNQIDRIWDAFWSGGISNPLEVIEQTTYLLFLRRRDDRHTLEENKSTRLKQPMERRVFSAGKDPRKRPYEDLRWSRFRNFSPADMFTVIGEHAFPVLLSGQVKGIAGLLMDARLLYESPFTDVVPRRPEALFTSTEVDELVAALDRVSATALAA